MNIPDQIDSFIKNKFNLANYKMKNSALIGLFISTYSLKTEEEMVVWMGSWDELMDLFREG